MDSRRRAWLKAAPALVVGAVLQPSFASAITRSPLRDAQVAMLNADFWRQPRELWINRPALGVREKVLYFADGKIDQQAYLRLCRICMDAVDHVAVEITPRLFDLLWADQEFLASYGYTRWFDMTSGYRTDNHNAALENSARLSMHRYGYALDGKRAGLSIAEHAHSLRSMASGGVGEYSAHVHMDVWRPRAWRSKHA